jgi:hypothetical protein
MYPILIQYPHNAVSSSVLTQTCTNKKFIISNDKLANNEYYSFDDRGGRKKNLQFLQVVLARCSYLKNRDTLENTAVKN